jgi:polyphosphate kinase 2 (PPK2 family)
VARSRLARLNMRASLKDKDDYESKLEALQHKMLSIQQAFYHSGRRGIVAVEGWDAAGKGGMIRRLTEKLDPRGVKVWPIGPPEPPEQGRHYLYRFWTKLPEPGSIAVFDRTWYGRVLVERVEKFCSDDAWMRAYDEINAFEEQLARGGTVLVKFWLAITPQEQLRRFEERQATPHKNFKITDEDWRNRTKWPLYEQAVGDMVDRTSTDVAPWHVVASDDKLFARVEVLRTLCDRIEAALGAKPRR